MTGGPAGLWPPRGWTLEPWLPLLSSVAFWLLTSSLVGLLANRVPETWLRGLDTAAARLGVRRWKRWIPDAGAALPGGVSKASLVRRDAQSLERLVLETRRAEMVHWALLVAGGLPALWLPPAGVAVNTAFALAFNLPCLRLQRENRARLRRCLERLKRRVQISTTGRSNAGRSEGDDAAYGCS
ncbi:MAG: hypothetical protein VKP63_02225 [Cyanobacteriota bacterium]|nr:hypothetical protein [Cyanobacteriota bacterium]